MDASSGSLARQSFRCDKSKKDVSLSDPRCLNPTGYCRFRAACPIHSLERSRVREGR